ncbi:MAG: ABC transporter substrate-binding protein [Pseudomonadota bacterium]
MIRPSQKNPPFSLDRRQLMTSAAAAGVALMPWRATQASVDLPAISGRDPRTLVIAIDTEVPNLDPATNVEWAYGLAPVYETLMRLKGTSPSEVEPALATAVWPHQKRGYEYQIWEMTLREGVNFHDGTACNAESVKQAILRTVDHPFGLGIVWWMENGAEQITVLDDYRLRFEFTFQRPFFPLELASQYGFWIQSPTAAEIIPPAARPVGTGPYIFESHDPGQTLTYKRNNEYWRGWDHGGFERVVTRTVPIASTRRQLIEQGAADIIFPGSADDIYSYREDPRFIVTDAPTMVIDYICLGCYGPLADPRARQAMNHAFDKKTYIEDALLNTARPAHGVFPSELATANPDIEGLQFDLGKAKELFDAAGVEEGTVLTYEFWTGGGNIAGELLQIWLAEIGIILELKEVSLSAWLADFFTSAPPEQRPNMYYSSWWPGWNHPENYASGLFFTTELVEGAGNAGLYSNAEVDQLLWDMFQHPFGEKLTAMSHRLQDILAREDPPWVPLSHFDTNLVVRKDIKGLELNPVYYAAWDNYRAYREGYSEA